MEVKELLGVCQFYIHLNSVNVGDSNETLQIKVTPTTLALDEIVIPLPHDVLPQSICGLICRENRLIFRISLNHKSAVVNSNPVTFTPHDYKQIFTGLHSGDSHMLQCVQCNHDILRRKIIIGQVVSDSLDGIDASDIFCHRDAGALEFEKCPISSSQSQLLSFGIGYFKLPNFDDQNLQTLLDDDIVYCERCFNWLGLWNCNVLHLWIDTVKFMQSPEQCTPSTASKIILYNVIRQKMNECFFPICNIRLACKISRSEENYLNLTIFDRNNTLWEYDSEQLSRFRRVSYLKILFVFKRGKIGEDDNLFETVQVSKATLLYTLKTLNSHCDDLLSTPERVAFLPT